MYRTIDTSIWNDPRIHKLDYTAKLLAVYMFSNDRAHVTGLYFFSIALACDELGIDVTKIRKALKQLIEVNFCQHDSERRVIWVRNMWKRQPHAGVHLDRLQDHFKTLNGTPLVGAFLSKYPHLKQYVTNLNELVTNQNESALQEIEQEIEQDIVPPSPPAPTTKKDQVVELKSQLPDYITKYPNLDVVKEFEKWQDWMAAKGKTFKNYQAAFRNWLRNAEEFRKTKYLDKNLDIEAGYSNNPTIPEDPAWTEIKALRSYDFQCLRQEAMPYARQKSMCGDKRDPPEALTREFMIQIFKAERDKLNAD